VMKDVAGRRALSPQDTPCRARPATKGNAGPYPTRPASTADVGDLFPSAAQGIEDIDNIGHGASGSIIPKLVPSHDDLPPLKAPADRRRWARRYRRRPMPPAPISSISR
jgi:hypothetical protein